MESCGFEAWVWPSWGASQNSTSYRSVATWAKPVSGQTLWNRWLRFSLFTHPEALIWIPHCWWTHCRKHFFRTRKSCLNTLNTLSDMFTFGWESREKSKSLESLEKRLGTHDAFRRWPRALRVLMVLMRHAQGVPSCRLATVHFGLSPAKAETWGIRKMCLLLTYHIWIGFFYPLVN